MGERELLGFLVGVLLAAATSPVGISGAVFLLPVQLTLFHVPNPQVTPTNLLYNVISGPGALLRYLRQRQADGALTRALLLGSTPGVVAGAVLRVHVVDGPDVFRLLAAAVLLPTGVMVLGGAGREPGRGRRDVSARVVTALAFVVGIVGGLYGIGGGSVLGPLLVGAGLPVRRVAPAALFATFVSSLVGVVAFLVLATTARGASIAPDLSLGVATGLGGLVGGYIGARLQPRLPERGLRMLLGLLAIALAIGYVAQVVAA